MGGPTSAERPINAPRLVLCEGVDECDLFKVLRKERGLTEFEIEIVSAGGKDALEKKWGDVRRQSGGSRIKDVTLVFDSEDDPQAAQQKARAFAQRHQGPDLRFYLAQLPSEREKGSLETLIRKSIPPSSLGFDCATRWETCVQAEAETAFDTQARRDKAWLQVWLTHRTTSTASRIGYAVSKNAALRAELAAGLQPLECILNTALERSGV